MLFSCVEFSEGFFRLKRELPEFGKERLGD